MRSAAASVLLLSFCLAGAAPSMANSTLQTDKVVIQSLTGTGHAACGILHFLVKVEAVTGAGEKRAYYITYCSSDQPLPEIGATCHIFYSYERVSGAVVGDTSDSLSRGPVRYVDRFSCVDPEVRWDGLISVGTPG